MEKGVTRAGREDGRAKCEGGCSKREALSLVRARCETRKRRAVFERRVRAGGRPGYMMTGEYGAAATALSATITAAP